MSRSIERWEEIDAQLKPVVETLNKYEANKIALRKNILEALWKQRRDLESQREDACPHDKVYIFRDSYTDVGYGCDRHYYHYDMYCDRCKQNLTKKTDRRLSSVEGLPKFNTSGPYPLFDAVQVYVKRESLTEEELRSFGVRREVHTTTVYNMVKI